MKPLMVDLPYPSTEGIEKDPYSVMIIKEFFSGLHGELTAILQYVYHSFYFEKSGDTITAELLESISVAEMKHVKILGKLILDLGCDPWYGALNGFSRAFYDTSKVAYSKTCEKMLLDDISAEMMAIKGYDRGICALKNERVSAVIARIRLDEELHVSALKERLSELCKN